MPPSYWIILMGNEVIQNINGSQIWAYFMLRDTEAGNSEVKLIDHQDNNWSGAQSPEQAENQQLWDSSFHENKSLWGSVSSPVSSSRLIYIFYVWAVNIYMNDSVNLKEWWHFGSCFELYELSTTGKILIPLTVKPLETSMDEPNK